MRSYLLHVLPRPQNAPENEVKIPRRECPARKRLSGGEECDIIVFMKELNINNFKKETESGVCVVDFWASWCGPCRMLAPVMEYLAAERPAVKFFKGTGDEESALAAASGISSIPAVFRLDDGKATARHVGYAGKADIARALGL